MYFDPGIGSLIIQAIIGILAVGGGYLAMTKTKIKSLFSKNKDAEISKNSSTDLNLAGANDDEL